MTECSVVIGSEQQKAENVFWLSLHDGQKRANYSIHMDRGKVITYDLKNHDAT